jgi:hypothetical protein
VEQLGRWLLWDEDDGFEQLLTAPPAGVQRASIYSHQDAVVAWPACVDGQPGAVNIAVQGSHLGLPWNPAVYRELATLLVAQAAVRGTARPRYVQITGRGGFHKR